MAEKGTKKLNNHTAKFTAVILSVLMLSVMMFSAFYVTAEANHDCCGEDCPICVHIEQCESMLRGAGEGTFLLGLAVFLAVLSSEVFAPTGSDSSLFNPITSKVRMNN